MQTSLVIMAAGIGSRYGGGIKQLEHMDNRGHIIMDYSIHDAIAAGFNKVIFIIRKDIEADFRAIIGDRIEAVCKAYHVEVGYAFQDLHDIPVEFPEGRTKPWGTGQAVLAAKELIREPFVVINADDYYGKNALKKMREHLVANPEQFCMAGFILKNTLSDNGGVTRGICHVDADGYLTNIEETRGIVKTADGAEVGGRKLDVNSYVSMNMWGFTPDFVKSLEDGFKQFFAVSQNLLKDEYLIPIYVGDLLRDKKISVKVLETQDTWFGVTYKEDAASVKESFRQLIESGVYSEDLYGDL